MGTDKRRGKERDRDRAKEGEQHGERAESDRCADAIENPMKERERDQQA